MKLLLEIVSHYREQSSLLILLIIGYLTYCHLFFNTTTNNDVSVWRLGRRETKAETVKTRARSTSRLPSTVVNSSSIQVRLRC